MSNAVTGLSFDGGESKNGRSLVLSGAVRMAQCAPGPKLKPRRLNDVFDLALAPEMEDVVRLGGVDRGREKRRATLR